MDAPPAIVAHAETHWWQSFAREAARSQWKPNRVLMPKPRHDGKGQWTVRVKIEIAAPLFQSDMTDVWQEMLIRMAKQWGWEIIYTRWDETQQGVNGTFITRPRKTPAPKQLGVWQ